MAHTRKDKRAPVSLKVRFKSATVDEFIEHYCKDVSRGGIFIKSSQPMVIGTLLKFQFQLKDESALIRGVGRVVWTRAEEDAGEDQPAGMGIKFIKMDNDSRAIVERIVEGHASEEGTYERGRKSATTFEPNSSAPPSAQPGNEERFFPDLPPAELPPEEDRTAVRHAAQFLAAALQEGGTDEAAAREAQQKAAEARQRTEEIEAERRKEAEQKKRKAQAPAEPLPSMIIDPTLDAAPGSEAERPTELTLPRAEEPLTVERARQVVQDDSEREPDTEPPPAPVPATPTTTTSIPQTSPPERTRTRTSWLPIAIIVALLAIAATVALRGGPAERPVAELRESADEEARRTQPDMVGPAPSTDPAPFGAIGQEAEPEPTNEQKLAERVAEAGAQPLAAEAEVERVAVKVATTPRGAVVHVDDVPQGAAPLELSLAIGTPVVVSVRAPGYAEVSTNLTPKDGAAPLRLELKPLPYIVHVESTPSGASVNVAGHRATTPAEVRLDAPPAAPLSVTARLRGHATARTRLAPRAFREAAGAMRAELNLALEPSLPGASGKDGTPAARPKEPRRTAPPPPVVNEPEQAASGGAPRGADTAAPAEDVKAGSAAEKKPAPPAEAPKPAPAAEPKEEPAAPSAPAGSTTEGASAPPAKSDGAGEPLPENPFGD